MIFNSIRMIKNRNNKNRTDELVDLRERMRTIKSRLKLLNKQIGEIQDHHGRRDVKAVVDPRRCVGCGICADNCPSGAVVIEETARIISGQCKGCGICNSICPRGAISLRRTWSPEQEKKTGTI